MNTTYEDNSKFKYQNEYSTDSHDSNSCYENEVWIFLCLIILSIICPIICII